MAEFFERFVSASFCVTPVEPYFSVPAFVLVSAVCTPEAIVAMSVEVTLDALSASVIAVSVVPVDRVMPLTSILPSAVLLSRVSSTWATATGSPPLGTVKARIEVVADGLEVDPKVTVDPPKSRLKVTVSPAL